jgi:hypothetical protein
MDRRREHVRLLAIFHFVYAGLVVLGTLVPIFWLLAASLWWPELVEEAQREGGGVPVMATGAIAMGFAGFGILLGWIWAGCLVFAGRSLLNLSRYTYCLVVAGVACLGVPLGTVLGVTSLVVLNREDVRELFEPAVTPPASA